MTIGLDTQSRVASLAATLGAAGADPSGTTADCTYLTPESLLTYCQTRLGGLDAQMKQMFAAQQKTNADVQSINELLATLNSCASKGFDMNTLAGRDIIGAVQYAINKVGADSKAGQRLLALRDKIADRMDPTYSMKAALNRPDAVDAYWNVAATAKDDKALIGALHGQPGEGIKDNEVQLWINDAKGIQSDLTSGAELNMIQLQSVMSQRQTAIQLTTNLIQALGDQMNKIAANVGH